MKQAHFLGKKILFLLLAFALLLAQNFSLFSFLGNNVFAAIYSGENLSISNENFNSNTSSSYPYEPNNWTATADSKSTGLVTGVINVDETTFINKKSDYKLEDNPLASGDDNYVLMINSTENTVNAYGYKSSDFTLEANANYRISINVKTSLSDLCASLYLVESDDENLINNTKIESINSPAWTTYYLYVTTSNYKSETVHLELWLGTKNSGTTAGVVFFDNISATKISNQTLRNAVTNENSHADTHYYYTNLSLENVVTTYNMNSNPFTFKSATNTDNTHSVYGTFDMTSASITYPDSTNVPSAGTDLSYQNNYSFGIKNKLANKICFESNDSFTLIPNRIYQFSIMVKVADITADGAFIKLAEQYDGEDEDYAKTDKAITAIASTDNDSTNDYVEYSIFVKSDALEEKVYKMQIGLGSEADAIGEAYFTNFKVRVVPTSNFSSPDTSTQKTIDLTSNYSSSTYFANHDFNLMDNNNTNTTDPIYPAGVPSWTHTASEFENLNAYGIISTKNFSDIQSNFVGITNPGIIAEMMTASENNNVLMMNNAVNDAQSTISGTTSLTANKYYRFSLYVQTQLLNADSRGADVILQTEDGMIVAQKTDIKTGGVWQRIDLHLLTNENALTVQLKLVFGTSNDKANGYAFFDKTIFVTPSTYIENADEQTDLENTLFDEVLEQEFVIKSNMTDSLQHDATKENGYYAPTLYTGANLGGSTLVKGGVIDLTESNGNSVLPTGVELGTVDGNKVLSIASNTDVDYKYTTRMSFAMTSGNYYKISVKVYTYSLHQATESQNIDDDDEVIPYGARIALSNFDDKFEGINTDGNWKTYAFYINPDSDTSSTLELSLGYTDALTSGFVYFDNVSFEKFENETDYKVSLVDYKTHNNSNTLVAVTAPIADVNDDEDDAKNNDSVNLWILVPSIVTALSVIIALVGVAVKKLNIKKVQKTRVSNYDREKTVVKQMYRRQAIEKRDAELKGLLEEQKVLAEEKAELEKNYKKDMNDMRSLKLKRTDDAKAQIAKLEKQVKADTKTMSVTGVRLNNIEKQIARLNSETYLLELQQQLIKTTPLEIIEENQNNKK